MVTTNGQRTCKHCEINHQYRYTKYDPFILIDVVYQAFDIPYPSDVPNKSSWWVALTNKPIVCTYMYREGENAPLVFRKEFVSSTNEIFEALPQFLMETSNVYQEVQVAEVCY